LVDIIIVRTANSIIYDPRVRKIIGSLRKKYSISALGWNRELVSQDKINNYISKVELFNLKTSFWKPSLVRILIRLLIFFPPFWLWVFTKLLASRPKVVHACDLDAVLPCYIYKTIFRKKLVFDVFDRYAMTFIPSKLKTFYSVVNFSEEFFSEKADVLITVSDKVMKTFQRKPKLPVTIMNCPEDYPSSKTLSEKYKTGIHRLVYTGAIKQGRALENMILVIKDLDNIELIVAGPVIDKELFQQMLAIPNMKYAGYLDPRDAIDLEASANVMIALYDPDVTWNSITVPNKIFEAMMCGIPVISNVCQDLINELECGIVVDYHNVDQIRETIIKLNDNPGLRKRLGDNGRKAFLEKYNWNVMEQRLYKVYEDLL
jgi:glycosyltransferase involved in cell wall biosynthesis